MRRAYDPWCLSCVGGANHLWRIPLAAAPSVYYGLGTQFSGGHSSLLYPDGLCRRFASLTLARPRRLTGLQEARALWAATNNTVGFNHMIASAPDAAAFNAGDYSGPGVATVFETMVGGASSKCVCAWSHACLCFCRHSLTTRPTLRTTTRGNRPPSTPPTTTLTPCSSDTRCTMYGSSTIGL
jgi:hypothetical protein